MRKPKTKEESYNSCQSGGFFRKLRFINKERIRSLVGNADTNVNSAIKLVQTLSKEDQGWMNVYTMHYENLAGALSLRNEMELGGKPAH